MASLSLRKVEANRRNALKSTGPRTLEGKQRSRWNALTHGVLAKEAVILRGDGKESRRDFHALLTRLGSELQPQGVLEEMLVQRIAVSYWRLARALRCEVGEIRSRADTAVDDGQLQALQEFLETKHPGLGTGESGEGLRVNTLYMGHLLEVLDQVEGIAEKEECITDNIIELLEENFQSGDDNFLERCLALIEPMDSSDNAGDDSDLHSGVAPLDMERKTALLKLIKKQKQALRRTQKELENNDALREEARIASFSLAPGESLERILRYETTIDRQLHRAMDQLERLQRRRAGEAVPPPMKATLTVEK